MTNKLSAIFSIVKGLIGCLILLMNTIVCVIPFYGVVIVKLLVPITSVRRLCTRALVWISELWIQINNVLLGLLQNTQWEILGQPQLSTHEWYFLVCNHQAWTDIFVLQKVLAGKIPPFKFFIKQQLLWLPLVGVAWWALDCPFMKRYSKETLEKNPHLRDIDMQTTQKKCLEFMHAPVTIFNFVEGTRFTQAKHDAQHSSYQKLLNPKAGGLAYAIGAMNGKVKNLINVTIAYPDGKMNFWDFLCGNISKIKVHIEVQAIPPEILTGDYLHDPHYRAAFKQWLVSLWDEKDALLVNML